MKRINKTIKLKLPSNEVVEGKLLAEATTHVLVAHDENHESVGEWLPIPERAEDMVITEVKP